MFCVSVKLGFKNKWMTFLLLTLLLKGKFRILAIFSQFEPVLQISNFWPPNQNPGYTTRSFLFQRRKLKLHNLKSSPIMALSHGFIAEDSVTLRAATT